MRSEDGQQITGLTLSVLSTQSSVLIFFIHDGRPKQSRVRPLVRSQDFETAN